MSRRKRVLVLGTGGNSLDIAEIVQMLDNDLELLGFLDDAGRKDAEPLPGVRVLGPLSMGRSFPDSVFINGIGSTASFRAKKDILARTGIPDERFLTLVHPSASISRHARLGRGVAILQQATIAVKAEIGDHVIVLPSAVVSHDCIVGSYSCIAGGASLSGGVTLGESCYIGANASVRQGVRIGEGALVGMGAVVVADVPRGEVWAGVPARRLRTAAK